MSASLPLTPHDWARCLLIGRKLGIDDATMAKKLRLTSAELTAAQAEAAMAAADMVEAANERMRREFAQPR